MLDWKKHGLIEPEDVRLATSEYRDDSDTIGRFLRQTCKLGEHSRKRPWRVMKRELFELYQAWCHETSAYEMGERAFAKEMKAKRFADMTSDGAWWLGLRPAVEVQDIKDGRWTAADERPEAESDANSGDAAPLDDWDSWP